MLQITPPGPRFMSPLDSDPQVMAMNENTKSTVLDSSSPEQTAHISPQQAAFPVSRTLINSILLPPNSSNSLLPPPSSYFLPPSLSGLFPSPSSILFQPSSTNIAHPNSTLPPLGLPPTTSIKYIAAPASYLACSSYSPPPPSNYILKTNVLPPGSMIFGGKLGVEEVEWMRKGLEQKIMESRIWRKMGRKLQKYVMKFMKVYPSEKSEAEKFEVKVKKLAEDTEKKLVEVTKQQSENLRFFEDKIEINERYNLMVKENEERQKEIHHLRSNICKLENRLLESEHVINKLEFEKADYFKQSFITTEISKRLTAYEQKLIFFGNELEKSYQTIQQKTEAIQQEKEIHEAEEKTLKDQLLEKEKIISDCESKITLLSSELMRTKSIVEKKHSQENIPLQESKLQDEDSNVLVLLTLQYDQLKNELITVNSQFKSRFRTLTENIHEKSREELFDIFNKVKKLNEEFSEELDAMPKKIKELNQLNFEGERHPISKEVMELREIKIDLENRIKELKEKL